MASGYEKEHLLGHGGVGAVYRARCRKSGRVVALKVLLEPADEEGMRRFERERRTLAEAEHPALIKVLDWGIDEAGHPYLAMPYLEHARSLQAWLDDQWRGGPPRDLRSKVGSIMNDLCAALDHLHDRGIVHRDIKPSNVLITRNDRAVLIDLGLALLAGSNLTADGIRLGTPAYSAPELYRCEEATPASDVYMAGLLLHEMLTGHRASADLPAFLTAIAEGRRAFPPVSTLNPALGPQLDAIVRRATEAEPAERYRRASELAGALEAAADDAWSAAPRSANATERLEIHPPARPDVAPRRAVGVAPVTPRKRTVVERPPARRVVWPIAFAVGGLAVLLALRAPATPPPRLLLEPGFRAVVVRTTTPEPCTGVLSVHPATGPVRELGDPAPVREHRFVVDGLAPGAVARFEFAAPGAGPVVASAMGPEPPRLLSLTRLSGRAKPTLLVELTRPAAGELYLSDRDGNEASVPLEAVSARHEVAVPPANWAGTAMARVRARSVLGEVEELPSASLALR